MDSIFETAHEIGEHLVRISGKPLEQEAMEQLMLEITKTLMRYECEAKQQWLRALLKSSPN